MQPWERMREQIRDARRARGWSQEELGRRIGVAKSTVANWESGRREPDWNMIAQLLRLLGLDAGEEPDRPPPDAPNPAPSSDITQALNRMAEALQTFAVATKLREEAMQTLANTMRLREENERLVMETIQALVDRRDLHLPSRADAGTAGATS